jgi:hypothetical protein
MPHWLQRGANCTARPAIFAASTRATGATGAICNSTLAFSSISLQVFEGLRGPLFFPAYALTRSLGTNAKQVAGTQDS